MPNIWSKAGQFIAETISGAKTKDEAYKIASEKMLKTEQGINSLKSVLANYNKWVEGFCKYIKELNEAIQLIYKDTPFQPVVDNFMTKNNLILSEMDQLSKNVAKLHSKTSAWDQIFIQAKELKKSREEKRKNFEHYEQKLQKINKDTKKHRDSDLVKRNEEKYKTAAKEYIEISEKGFDIIGESMKLSWNLINPIIDELISNEKSCFSNIYNNLESNSKIYEEVKKNLEMKAEYTAEGGIEDYDPTKYFNSKSLMKKISLSFHEKRKNNKKVVVKRFSAMGTNIKKNYCSRKTAHVIENFVRNTNSFGKIPEDRRAKFLEIEDFEY